MAKNRQTPALYISWRKIVNQVLERTYAISIEDAGLDDQQLLSHWSGQENPEEFVRWFGAKYDLQPSDKNILHIS